MSKTKKQNQSSKKKAAGEKPAAQVTPRMAEYRKHMARWESWQEEKRRLKREARKKRPKSSLKKFDKFKTSGSKNT